MTLALMPGTMLLMAQNRFSDPIILDKTVGLSHDYVNCITSDQNGFMWFGTNEGLNRFDGMRVENFLKNPKDSNSLIHNYVIDIWPDEQGRIWVGTTLGMSIYDPATKQFKNLKPNSKEANQLPGSRVNKIFKDRQGEIWLGMSETGLVRYSESQDSFEVFEFEVEHPDQSVDVTRINSVLDLTQDIQNDSILWLATLTGLIKFNKYSNAYQWFLLETDDKNIQFLFNSLKEVFQTENQMIFVGSWGGFGYLDPKERTLKRVTMDEIDNPEMSLAARMTKNIWPKSKNVLWVTNTRALLEYNLLTQKVEKVYLNDRANSIIYGVQHVDNKGIIWNRTPHGVQYFNPLCAQFKTYQYPIVNEDFYYFTRSVAESTNQEKLYLLADQSEGLYLFEKATESWEIIRPTPGYLNNQIAIHGQEIIRINEDSLLIVATFGFYLFEEKKKKLSPLNINMGEGAPVFRRMVRADNGEFWIGSRRQGLFRLNLTTGVVTNYKKELEANGSSTRFQWIETVFKDSRGNIWIRTSSGYSIFEKTNNRFLNFPFENEEKSPNSFYEVGNFAEDGKGRVWVAGSSDGIGLTDPNNLEAGIIQKITWEDGLVEPKVDIITTDARGHIWIDQENGLSKINMNDLSIQYFDQGYGQPGPNESLFTQLSSGEIIIGIRQGFGIFHPDSLRINHEKPQPYITAFKVFDKDLINNQDLFTLTDLDLSYKQNFFSFEFSAIAYNLPEKISFAYMLEGVDEDWVSAGQRRYASYTNIGGGDYTFQLKAANNEGIWNEEVYRLKIHISTPWWKTWWFWLGLFIMLLTASIAFFRWRVNQIRKEELMKTDFEKRLANVEMNALRAQMNPHFIFNCLNSIDYYILKNDMEKASDYLNRFSRLIRLILQNSRSNYVNLKDELEALKLYIEMESLRFDEQFDYEVKVAKGLILEEIEIPPMLLQPYVENAIWHGLMQKNGKGKLDLTITKENGHLQCIIEDNGIGREAAMAIRSKSATRRKSMGMQITEDRIGMINRLYNTDATVNITDMKDNKGTAKGTRVNLEIPL